MACFRSYSKAFKPLLLLVLIGWIPESAVGTGGDEEENSGNRNLFAVIEGGSVLTRGLNETVTADASRSYDPEVGRGNYIGMTFHWSCVAVSSSATCPVLSNSSNDKVVYLDTGKLQVRESYKITVVIRKDTRNATAIQIIRIVEGHPQPLSIRCVLNCAPKVTSSQRFSLSSYCTGSPCEINLWWLFKYCKGQQCDYTSATDPLTGAKIEAVSMTALTYTPLNATNVIFKENVLDANTVYIISSIAEASEHLASSITLYHFMVASPPKGGVCSIAPRNGSALDTTFRIICSNWTADDSLLYKYQYQLESGLYSLLYDGKNSSIFTWLPSGNPSQGHFVNLKTTISSLNGGHVEVHLKVQVVPSLSGGDLLVKLTDNSSLFQHYLDEVNVEKAALLVNSLFPTLSEDSSIDPAKKKVMREYVIKKFSAVKIDNFATLLLISSVIGTATDDTDVLPVQSLNTAMVSVDRMVSLLKTRADEKDTSELLSIHQSAENLVHCLRNVLHMGAQLATVNATKASRTDIQDQGKKFVAFSLKLVDDVSEAVLSTKLPGDEFTSITTGDVHLVVGRYLPINLYGMRVEAGNATFQLPSLDDVFEKTENATFVDIKMISLPLNPFTWDYSRRRVHSDVLSLEVKDNQRKSIDLSHLTSNINISLPLHTQDPPLELEHFAKPARFQYHVVRVPFENSLMNIEIKPQIYEAQYFLYVKYDRRPTTDVYDLNQNISSTCVLRNKTGFNCTAITFSFVARLPGSYYIGIRGEKILSQKNITRKRRSCFGRARQKRSGCVEVKHPSPTPPQYTNVNVKPTYDQLKDVNYTLGVHLGGCVYWSPEQEKWTGDGCKVASTNTKDVLMCSCNHLTSFGGGLFIAPHPIDFDKVQFKNLDETGNVIVLITVIMVFIVYLMLLLLVRQADKIDVKKAGPSIDLPSSSNAFYQYEITIETGVWENSATTANIAMVIYGADGNSSVLSLGRELGAQREMFARGNSDTFLFRAEGKLGPLLAVRIGHDNSGSDPSWFLTDVIITDGQTHEQWKFPFTGWLTLDGGNNECVIEPLSNDQRFKYDLFVRCSKGFTGVHLWLSVFTKQPGDSFSRVHRASCCLSVLFSAMLTNAMFYKLEGKTEEQVIQVGPLLFSWRQVIVGIQSALIVAPVNILIVTLFKVAANRAARRPSVCSPATVLLCLAWLLCLASAVTSAVFTIFYSLTWGREISNQWLSSVLVSFAQDVTITEPLKVFLVAVLLAGILGRKMKGKDGYDTLEQRKLQEIYQGDCLHNINSNKRQQRTKQLTVSTRLFRFIREIWLHLMFMFLLMIVCYGNKSRHRYLMHQSVQNSLQAFDEVARNEKFWNWMRGSYIPAMYAESWYNGIQENITVYNGDKHSILVGMPQARQLRVKQTRCLEEAQDVVTVCYGPYSDGGQDKTPFSTPGWIAMANLTNKKELELLCPKPWRYQSATETDSHPKWGDNIYYAGGGYVADLGYRSHTAGGVVHSLELGEWLDRKTRVVMLEFAFFNPPTNVLAVSTYFYERFPTGDANPYTRTRTILLYSQDTGTYQLYLICQILFIVLNVFYFMKECFKLFRQKLSYFRSPWNWLELAQILVAVLAVVLYILKVDETTVTIRELRRNIYANVSFDAAILWNEGENGVLAILTFIVSVKLLRLARFNHQVGIFSDTLYLGFKRLLSFTVVLLIAFVAFLHFGILIFGDTVLRYSTIKQAVYFQLELILGKVKARTINQLAEANETFSRMFLVILLSSLTITFMNFFIAALNDSLLEAQTRAGVEREVDEDPQTTSTNNTERSNTKVNFDLTSKAIKRMGRSRSTGKRDRDLNFKGDRACKGKCEGHSFDFEFVSAAINASRKGNDFKTGQMPPQSNALEDTAQTWLDFAKISRGIKRMCSVKVSTSIHDETTSGGRRNVRFSDQELQKHYSDLDDKQSNLFKLIGKILEQPGYEDDVVESLWMKYKDTLRK